MKAVDRIYIVAAGTSYHAGLLASVTLNNGLVCQRKFTLPQNLLMTNLVEREAILYFLSQLWETADSSWSVDNGSRLWLTNKQRGWIQLWHVKLTCLAIKLAGPEIAVALTKAYTAQIIVAIWPMPGDSGLDLKHELWRWQLKCKSSSIKRWVQGNCWISFGVVIQPLHWSWFDAAVAVEAALKLKEISYVQQKGFCCWWIKARDNSLIEEGTGLAC